MNSKSSLNVLLVEDNPDHALLAKNSITSSKEFLVTTAASAEEAIDVFENQGSQIHLVISDFNLPGRNGLEFLEWLNEKDVRIPFIMMTGSGDEKTAVKAMQSGAYNYIVKDDNYLTILPHVIDQTFLKYLAQQEKERYEREIREKNVALEKANRELKKLDQLKSDFISSVSHDIRTPLQSIQESIALVLEGIVDPHTDKGKQILEVTKRSILRLSTMINDLLDFSKLEAGKMRVRIEPADIQILIDEVLGSLKSLSEKKRIKLCFDHQPDVPKVLCDAERMIQVFTNLVGNAIKFTPENGSITVKVEMAINKQVHVRISDTGIGIDKNDLERIFDRFEQVKDANDNKPKGTGLGLSICRELLKLHGGKIWAESELGKGSSFIVALSIDQPAVKQRTPIVTERLGT